MQATICRQERYARGLAAGRTMKEAAVEAGFAPTSDWPKRLAKRDVFKARVLELSAENAHANPGLEPVIAALMDGAQAAMESAKKSGSGAAFNAARGMLAEAARLKQKLPRTKSSDLKEWARKLSPEVDRVAAAARSSD